MSRTSVQRISAVFAAFGFYELESMFPGTRQHKCGGGGVFLLLFVFFYIKNNKKQNKTMLPGTRQHKRGRGGGVHTKISRPTASLKEGQYFTSHCLPPPILPCHTACFSQFVWRWGSLLAPSDPLRSPMKICCIFRILLGVVNTAGIFSGCFFKDSNCKTFA